ncbi:Dhm1p putative DNA strand exchange protein, partial [Giardia duodenalis]
NCEDEKLFAEVKREREDQSRDEREEAKEMLSLIDKDRARRLTTQQTMLAVDELTSSPPQYHLKPPPEYAALPPKSEYLMIDDEIAAMSGKSVTRKAAQQSEVLDSLVQKISCVDFLLRSAQQRDNMPSETATSRPSASVISMAENTNQTFPRSATMRHLILEKREAELRGYLETLGTAEARTRKSMEELLTSIDAVRRGMIELRRKQAMLVDELVDFVKEKYRLDQTITEVAGVIGNIAVALSTIRIPVTDRQLPSDIQCLRQLKQCLFEHLCKLL